MAINVFDLAGIDLGLPTGVSLARRAPAYYSPDAEESILRTILNTGLSGIGAAANVLDTIGGPTRTALAGDWENVLPSIIDPSLRTGGREMLQSWGVLGENRPGFDWGDVAGVGAEIATDPLTWFTPLGLTKAGKLAKSAGILDELAHIAPSVGAREGRIATTLDQLLAPRLADSGTALAERMAKATQAAEGMGVSLADYGDQALSGLFVGPGGTPLFTGDFAQGVARKVDALGSAVRYGNIPGTNVSPGRFLGRLFDAGAGEARSRVAQESIFPQAFAERTKAGEAARGDVAEAVGTFRQAGYKGEGLDDYQELRRLVEGVDTPGSPAMAEAVSRIRSKDDAFIQEAADWGTSKALNDPEVEHFYRFATRQADKLPEGVGAQAISDFDQSALARGGVLTGIEGGTDTLMRIARDPEVRQLHDLRGGLTFEQRSQAMQQLLEKKFPEVTGTYAPKASQVKGQPPVLVGRGKAFSDWLLKLPKQALENGIFGNDPIADYAVGRVHAMDRLAGAKVAIRSLADVDMMAKAWKTTEAGGAGVPLSRVLGPRSKGGMGLNRKAALTKIAELRGMPAPGRAELRALAKEMVPKDLADDLARYYKLFDGPEAVGDLIKGIDNVNALFRTGVTSLFPAFHGRNLISGAINNWIKGLFSLRGMSEAKTIIEGNAADVADIPAVKRMLTDRGLSATAENASDMLRELAFAGDTIGRHVDESRGGTLLSDLEKRFAGGYGGKHGFSKAEAAKKYIFQGDGVSLNPLNVRGVGGRTKTTFGPAAAGEDIGYYTEGINRLSGLITGLRKGQDINQVMRDVNAAQVAYKSKNYTKFEQEVMTRVFPFYKYSRNAMPFLLNELAENPGGRMAKLLRVQDEMRGEGPGTPDYVRETASVALGKTPEGADRYITGFGLGYEDPLSFFGGGVRGTLLEAASRMSPVAKLPLEWATGESFFQKGPLGGREIDDLDPTAGRLLANLAYQVGLRDDQQGEPVQILSNRSLSQGLEFVLGNSPLSRVLSTARTITDPRKFDVREGQVDPYGVMNLLTGIRVSDISPAAQDRVIQERADALMQGMGAKTFTETYFPDEAISSMGPEDQQKAVQFDMLQKMLDRRRRERRLQMAGGI